MHSLSSLSFYSTSPSLHVKLDMKSAKSISRLSKKKSQGQTWETLTCTRTSFSFFAISFLAFTCNLLFIWRVVGVPNGLQCACKSTLCSQHNMAGRKFQSGGARPKRRRARHLIGAVRPQLEKKKERKMLSFKFDCSAADRQTSQLCFVHLSARHHCKPHKSYKNRRKQHWDQHSDAAATIRTRRIIFSCVYSNK